MINTNNIAENTDVVADTDIAKNKVIKDTDIATNTVEDTFLDNVEEKIIYERKVDAQGRAYATGKRKNSIAKVWLKAGNGKIIINNKDITKYLARPVLRMIVNQPFEDSNNVEKYDIVVKVLGGGLSGQAGAIRHGISKALVAFDPENRTVLKQGGFLTRDSRVVERKKYGRAKARKSFQFSKR